MIWLCLTLALTQMSFAAPDSYTFRSGQTRVKAPLEFTHKTLTDFKKYPEIISYVRRVDYDDKKDTLDVFLNILKYQFEIKFHVRIGAEGHKKFIIWEVIEGPFQGMSGRILEEELAENLTQISLEMTGDRKSLPLPSLVLNPLLKIVASRASKKMDSFINAQWASQAKFSGSANRMAPPRNVQK